MEKDQVIAPTPVSLLLSPRESKRNVKMIELERRMRDNAEKDAAATRILKCNALT